MTGPVVAIIVSIVLLIYGMIAIFSSRRGIGISGYPAFLIGVPVAIFAILARGEETAAAFASGCGDDGGEVVLVDTYVTSTAVPVGSTGQVIGAGEIYVYECRVDGSVTEEFESGEQIDGATDETE